MLTSGNPAIIAAASVSSVSVSCLLISPRIVGVYPFVCVVRVFVCALRVRLRCSTTQAG